MPGGRQTQVQKSMKKDGLIRHLARGRGGGGVRCQEGGADTRSKIQRRENVLESILPEDRGGAGGRGGDSDGRKAGRHTFKSPGKRECAGESLAQRKGEDSGGSWAGWWG